MKINSIKIMNSSISDDALDKIKELINSGEISKGNYVKEFEEKLASYLGVSNAILVSSGTAALHLALLSLELKPDDEVIIPAFSFVATANVVELVNAKIVFADVNIGDLCINTSALESIITEKTKVIMPVHEFGQAADMDKILQLTQDYNIRIIEDACCALGTEYYDKKVGTIGDMGCFSFHPKKTITTGEGGFIVTDNNVLAKRIRLLRNHGLFSKNNTKDLYNPGLNYRMNDVQAILGLDQFSIFDKILNEKIKQASIYNELFRDNRYIDTPMIFPDRKNTYQPYHILLRSPVREKLINFLKKRGVETAPGAYAIPKLTYYKQKYNLPHKKMRNSLFASENGLILPIGIHLKEDDIKNICHKIESFFKESVSSN